MLINRHVSGGLEARLKPSRVLARPALPALTLSTLAIAVGLGFLFGMFSAVRR
jgi:hypothetical protein